MFAARGAILGPSSMRAYMGSTMTGGGAVAKKMTIDTADAAYPNTQVTGGSTNRITIDKAGTVTISGRGQMAGGSTAMVCTIRKNGSGTDLATGNNANVSTVSTGAITVAANDYFELWQTDGGFGGGNVSSGSSTSYIQATP